jgi:hypothetical protein
MAMDGQVAAASGVSTEDRLDQRVTRGRLDLQGFLELARAWALIDSGRPEDADSVRGPSFNKETPLIKPL